MLMLLGGCTQMREHERQIVMKQMILGFTHLALESGSKVTGGQTVLNEWPLIGGVAMTTAKEHEFIRPENIVPGDVLVLTKPIGTQVAVNLHEWIANPKDWKKVEDIVSPDEEFTAYETAVKSMARLNQVGAKLMHKYEAHGATDITGFGILGHAENLANHQKASIDIELHTLPIIKGMLKVDEKLRIFKLREGFSAETSGGLLIALPSQEAAEKFCVEIEQIEGFPAWVVGAAKEGKGKGHISDQAKIIEI
eukprot:CAMPEP_0201489798 /NCGR_PEP_ID=MMETSP0151_2-20130828/23755_1 /ASSEMBLY_ACC=CAM_ASM_000257 /TAXON_ID=200890 /ORGANISM="Paramoeba atlantica, Strain 621/1 / CCAP 1560/9" /LENGTH=251 /DNA_ID=CAMNT_0047875493 /DNA_START=369 /DNA_END=1124 /DNA_ORIENTATION=-